MSPGVSPPGDFETGVIHCGGSNNQAYSWSAHKGHRACLECRRKKTKCDMRQPVCGLCCRTGGSCTFPTKRKTPEFRRPPADTNKKQRIDPDRLERLVDLLESKFSDSQAIENLSPPRSDESQSDDHPRDANKGGPVSFDPALNIPEPVSPDLRTTSTAKSPASPRDNAGCAHSRNDLSVLPSEGSYSLDVSEEVANNLVHLFFNKVQTWLPLLHRPRFLAKYMVSQGSGLVCPGSYSAEEALLLYGIFALAAGYSSHECFSGIPAPERGTRFIAKAAHYYKRLRSTGSDPTLLYLQGCILMTCYMQACGPCHLSWIVTGVCVRFAYDLDLCNVDERGEEDPSMEPAEWTELEERRRAFWLVWEVDAFGSALSRRPSAINRHRMAVRLPVADDAWFAEQPVESPILHPGLSKTWKALVGSPNQSERAWFLVANYLMAVSYDMYSSRHTPPRDIEELADSVACFSLAVAQRFGLETHPILFDSQQFAKSNWIIGIHLMIINARSFLSAIMGTWGTGAVATARELSRTIFHWHPEYIAFSHPFFACALLPVSLGSSPRPLQPPHNGTQIREDMLDLVLARYASVWKLGSLLLEVSGILNRQTEHSTGAPRLTKYFAIYFPQSSAPTHRAGESKDSQAAEPSNLENIEINANDVAGCDSFEQDFDPLPLPPVLSTEETLTRGFNLASEDMDFIPGCQDDWSSRLQLDYLCDDTRQFNYLEL